MTQKNFAQRGEDKMYQTEPCVFMLPVCVFERGLPMSIKHIIHIKPQNSGPSVSAGWKRARAGVYSGGSTAGPFSARSYY